MTGGAAGPRGDGPAAGGVTSSEPGPLRTGSVLVLAGSFAWTAVRVGVHKLTVPLPRMGPEVFLLFAPILAAPIALVALAIHFVARGRFAIRSDGELVLAGLPYSAMLLGLISPWLLALVPLLHPWFWRVLRASRPSQDGER